MGGSSSVKFGTVLLLIAFLGENVAARVAPDLAAVQSRLDEFKSEIDGFEQAISGTHVSDDDILRLSYRLEHAKCKRNCLLISHRCEKSSLSLDRNRRKDNQPSERARAH